MKKIIALLAVMVSFNASASCEALEGLSASVMKARQYGVRASELLDMSKDDSPSDKEFLKKLVTMAYKRPIRGSEETKNEAIAEFANELYIACINTSTSA